MPRRQASAAAAVNVPPVAVNAAAEDAALRAQQRMQQLEMTKAMTPRLHSVLHVEADRILSTAAN